MIEQKFNILNCFDDNIDNLDLTKNYIYVLKLVEDRYYVGRTGNILRRIEEHFTNNGAIYTKAYKPLKVIEVEEEKTNKDERIKTFVYMEKYGWENVRGSYWCSLKINNPLNKKLKVNKNNNHMRIELYGDDETIKQMYCYENKNIIEIGEKLFRTPGSIAYRLEQLSIVEKRQKAKGYYEYINSDLYKEICKKKMVDKIDKKREKYKLNKTIDSLKQDINLIMNDMNKMNIDINYIKNKIKQQYCNEIDTTI